MKDKSLPLQGGGSLEPNAKLPPLAKHVPPPPGYHAVAMLEPFEAYVGPFFEKRMPEAGPGFDGQGELWASFYVDERHVNSFGTVHGGMLMTFADSTLGIIAWQMNDRNPCVTLSMETNFLKSAKLGDLIEVRPKLVRKASSILFASGAFEVGGETIFTATSVWRLLKG